MRVKITLLPGDGIGPEVTAQAVRVLQAVATIHGYRFEFEEHAIGGAAIKQFGSPLPRTTLDACLASDAALLGAVGSPEYDHAPPNQRPAISYSSIAACSPIRTEVARGTDILIVRELLGGLYFGEPRGIDSSSGMTVATNTMRYSVEEIERVAKVAFEAARKRRGKVTSVDKANVLETSQLRRQTVIRVSQNYPDVTLEHLYVDACAMHLITNPRRFDVLLTENLFGDILSDEAAVITGSLGMLASATIGGEVGLYEPVHGSAPDIAGLGIANPCGAIASAAMMLRHSFGLEQEAKDIELAIEHVLEGGNRTPDIAGGTGGYVVTTSEIGELICEAVTEIADMRHAYHAV